jgi:hypothetical protein
MTLQKKRNPQKLIERWNLLAERHDLLKEYLLRPLREAKNQASGSASITSPDSIKRNQVLPAQLWRAMQDAFHKSERDIEALEKEMSTMDEIQYDHHGAPHLKD